MNAKTLRELAKFASGLVAADFLIGLFVLFGGNLPMTFFGMNFDERVTIEWMLFDVVLFAFLVHYGWRTGDVPRSDRERTFHRVAGILLAVVAALHLLRILFGVDLTIGSWEAPYWLSAIGAVVTAFLAYMSFTLARR